MFYMIQCPDNGNFICINLLLKETFMLSHINKYTDVRMEKNLAEIEKDCFHDNNHCLVYNDKSFVDINLFHSMFEDKYDAQMKKCQNDNERNEINNIFLGFLLKMGGSKTVNFKQFIDKIKKVKYHFESKGLF